MVSQDRLCSTIQRLIQFNASFILGWGAGRLTLTLIRGCLARFCRCTTHCYHSWKVQQSMELVFIYLTRQENRQLVFDCITFCNDVRLLLQMALDIKTTCSSIYRVARQRPTQSAASLNRASRISKIFHRIVFISSVTRWLEWMMLMLSLVPSVIIASGPLMTRGMWLAQKWIFHMPIKVSRAATVFYGKSTPF